MKAVTALLMASLLLGGCPDGRLPNPPPRTPHPKAETTSFDTPARLLRAIKPAPQLAGWI